MPSAAAARWRFQRWSVEDAQDARALVADQPGALRPRARQHVASGPVPLALARMTSDSRVFSSSRTLPGHECSRKRTERHLGRYAEVRRVDLVQACDEVRDQRAQVLRAARAAAARTIEKTRSR
jgi:hypothetical protein